MLQLQLHLHCSDVAQRITKDDMNGETALVDTDVCRPRKRPGQPI